MPTSELLRVAEVLDAAGFKFLEVSGGGVFDSAVRRGIESPWERIRALNSRVRTPLGMALRGRFLVGSRPVDSDFVSRFIACAAENGIEVFRLNDPLNDVSNLREAARAIAACGAELDAARVVLHDPTGSLQPHRAGELVARLHEACGLPVGVYAQGSGGQALAAALEAARAGADLIATAVYPVALSLHRVSGESLAEALAGIGLDSGVDVQRLWQASDVADEHIGDEPVTPLAPRIAVRAAEYDLPAGLVAALEASLRAQGSADRLDEVLDELMRVRTEVGSPPLAAPIGQILASQALVNVLSASRYAAVVDEVRALYEGHWGTPPGPVDANIRRAIALTADPDSQEIHMPALKDVRARAEGLATSEEELLLLGLFGEDAEGLLRAIRGRASGDVLETGVERQRAERIREIVRVVQETGVGEVSIEEDGMRVTVRRTAEVQAAAAAPAVVEEEPASVETPSSNGLVAIEAPMVGVFYRAPEPGAPAFVEVGDTVVGGQTLCLLEAMKLFNELKAEAAGIVRAIHAENGQPVEFGQVLFELEPVSAVAPLDAL